MEFTVPKEVEGEPRVNSGGEVRKLLLTDVGDLKNFVVKKVKDVLGLSEKIYLLSENEYNCLNEMLGVYNEMVLFELFQTNYRLKLLLFGRLSELWRKYGMEIFSMRGVKCSGKIPTEVELVDFMKKCKVKKS